MNEPDYFGKKHGYMFYGDGAFSEFIFAAIKRVTRREFEDLRTIYELGAGMGRFSYALVNRFPSVFLIEPSREYAKVLRAIFPHQNTTVVESTADEFFRANLGRDSRAACFCFHVLHHLTLEQRRAIYATVKQRNLEACFVDPNPFNPLILIQVLLHPAMRFREEKGYLKLTRRRYLVELAEAGLARSEHAYFCLLPPPLVKLALKWRLRGLLLKLDVLCNAVPFLAAYQVVYYRPEAEPCKASSGSS